MKRILTLIIVVIVVLAVAYGATKMGFGQALIPPKSNEAKEGYTAVFLDNDQVYFGKLSSAGNVLVLKDVYYIRLNQAQPQKEGEEQAQPQLSLVKLGDQIHGPVDEMRILTDHVLFVERLKDESTVVRAIKQEKENKDQAQTPAPAAEQPTSTTTTTDQNSTNTPAATTPATTEVKTQ